MDGKHNWVLNFWENFGIFDENSIEKLNFYLFLWNLVAKIEPSEITSFFYNNFCLFWRLSPISPLRTPLRSSNNIYTKHSLYLESQFIFRFFWNFAWFPLFSKPLWTIMDPMDKDSVSLWVMNLQKSRKVIFSRRCFFYRDHRANVNIYLKDLYIYEMRKKQVYQALHLACKP